ncbi:hypothetical protein HCTV5_137 [Halovirus HCTV-5]|uniref:hypothetical protein n=1 Tax=Halovirus HCTV-5 TaxID=1273748 RepID=UPI00033484CA|nr:hypothetical protein M200_gp091 [Halovirus HCTV-5]AGM11743.1 hypothetical protein HCTV5_137 [Halovirus HCTV-5]
MPGSGFVFEEGEAIRVGSHGQHDFVYHERAEVTDAGQSNFVFEAGTGLGGGGLEDFENFDVARYAGDTGSFTDQQSFVKEGQFGGELTHGGPGAIVVSLDGTTERGVWYSAWLRTGDGPGSAGVLWMVQNESSTPNAYHLGLESIDDTMEYNDFGGGSGISEVVTNVTIDPETWYRVEFIARENGELYSEIVDGPSSAVGTTVTTTDNTYQSGGFGFRTGGNAGTAYFDDYRRRDAQ